LVNDGNGKYATTIKDYGDIELLVDYKTVPKADSGIYLRGAPQVQIWDYTDEAKFKLVADEGSAGLWINSAHAPGKDPLVEANKLLAAHGEDAGFKSVFNGRDFSGWAGPLENYQVVNGAIVCRPAKGGTIYTKEEFADFTVRLEFKVPPGGNNGLILRYPGE